MEMSTLIVLAIAIFIIVYRIKTWNDVNVLKKESEIVEEVVEYKVDSDVKKEVKQASKTAAKKETKSTAKKEPKKSATKAGTSYKKNLKGDVAKNIVLSQAVANTLEDQLVFEVSSQPKKGVTTLITLVEAFTKDDRAVGVIYESSKAGITVIKSFDVKMQANNQFKVATTFSKSLTVKKEDMKLQDIEATHLFVSDDKIVDIKDVAITLK